ncbi:hypothetical protein B0T17DRAFT_494259 [Bombardia bombarda]|uniref:Uncharacterized protein n=1 Tax=Bombardia bombarda TaxID=252184 RepID=A0AA39WUN6_9PEZI|nr:hypothetical protein B0T17DRAFT_494259 [Bombardia bombarda]
MFWQIGLVASLLASGAQAGIGSMVLEGMSRNSPASERRMQELAKATLVARGMLEARQTTGQGSDVALNADGTLDMPAWDKQANAACLSALNALQRATNPTGACVCYNLPALNNTTGLFEADLRLYRINSPTGEFAGVAPENIEVSLSYNGATVQAISRDSGAQNATKRELASRQAAEAPKLLQAYLFVGKIDQAKMATPMSMAELQAVLMPTVTLRANSAQGQSVSTDVSSNEAVFVAGVFSQSVVMSNFAMAELAVEDEIARLKNGTVAFVLPGVQIMIFPVGLVVTGTWMVLGFIAYGYGTYCRYTYRDQYRRRMQRIEKGGVARF